MKKVITYGTYDHLHQGHINLLKRAKALGDYLCVGVTTENFDITRGKINVDQSLMERLESVKALGIADEVFPEEYQGQKIDDIKRKNIDIFAIGSDWVGKFDYLNEYCDVVYLPRTEGISSTMIRSEKILNVGIVGTDPVINKWITEIYLVNGLEFKGIFMDEKSCFDFSNYNKFTSYNELINFVDIVAVFTRPEKRHQFILEALNNGKHVISESPIALNDKLANELLTLAKEKHLCLFDSIKTAYSLPFSRMLLLVKGGIIGDVKAIDASCTSLELKDWVKNTKFFSSITSWAPIAFLPIFKTLGYDYKDIYSLSLDNDNFTDVYTKVVLNYGNAIASVSLGMGVKTESDLKISGTKGYVYVPAPWWKNDYFEVRYENQTKNQKYYYNNDGEGIRTELVHLHRCISKNEPNFYLDTEYTIQMSNLISKLLKKL